MEFLKVWVIIIYDKFCNAWLLITVTGMWTQMYGSRSGQAADKTRTHFCAVSWNHLSPALVRPLCTIWPAGAEFPSVGTPAPPADPSLQTHHAGTVAERMVRDAEGQVDKRQRKTRGGYQCDQKSFIYIKHFPHYLDYFAVYWFTVCESKVSVLVYLYKRRRHSIPWTLLIVDGTLGLIKLLKKQQQCDQLKLFDNYLICLTNIQKKSSPHNTCHASH